MRKRNGDRSTSSVACRDYGAGPARDEAVSYRDRIAPAVSRARE